MEPDCRKITKEILPAIRAAITDIMAAQYHYRQIDIAGKLGIVQVAVSKYLNQKYSERVAEIKRYILQRDLVRSIVNSIVDNSSRDDIDKQINALCARLSATL